MYNNLNTHLQAIKAKLVKQGLHSFNFFCVNNFFSTLQNSFTPAQIKQMQFSYTSHTVNIKCKTAKLFKTASAIFFNDAIYLQNNKVISKLKVAKQHSPNTIACLRELQANVSKLQTTHLYDCCCSKAFAILQKYNLSELVDLTVLNGVVTMHTNTLASNYAMSQGGTFNILCADEGAGCSNTNTFTFWWD